MFRKPSISSSIARIPSRSFLDSRASKETCPRDRVHSI